MRHVHAFRTKPSDWAIKISPLDGNNFLPQRNVGLFREIPGNSLSFYKCLVIETTLD
jgi:hypothetical protein